MQYNTTAFNIDALPMFRYDHRTPRQKSMVLKKEMFVYFNFRLTQPQNELQT